MKHDHFPCKLDNDYCFRTLSEAPTLSPVLSSPAIIRLLPTSHRGEGRLCALGNPAGLREHAELEALMTQVLHNDRGAPLNPAAVRAKNQPSCCVVT